MFLYCKCTSPVISLISAAFFFAPLTFYTRSMVMVQARMEVKRGSICASLAHMGEILPTALTWALDKAEQLCGNAGEKETQSRTPPLPGDDLYRVGDFVELKVLTQGATPVGAINSTMTVRIREVVTRTYSFTAVVDILMTAPTQCASRTAFIKLHERRWSDTMRNYNGAKPWTEAIDWNLWQHYKGSICASL